MYTCAQIHTQPLLSSLGWWKTPLICNSGQPLSLTDPPAPPAPRGCRMTFWTSASKTSGEHTPSPPRMLQLWDCKERRFFPTCLHRDGECAAEKANLPENTRVTAQEKKKKKERGGRRAPLFRFQSARLARGGPQQHPLVTRAVPNSQQWLRRRGRALQGVCYYWNKSFKTLTVPRGSLRSWKSDGGGDERNASRGSSEMGEGYRLCAVTLYRGWL